MGDCRAGVTWGEIFAGDSVGGANFGMTRDSSGGTSIVVEDGNSAVVLRLKSPGDDLGLGLGLSLGLPVGAGALPLAEPR